VILIRQVGAQLERFCKKSGNFLPLLGWQAFWACLNSNVVEFRIHRTPVMCTLILDAENSFLSKKIHNIDKNTYTDIQFWSYSLTPKQAFF
jgi:hypothetical protein